MVYHNSKLSATSGYMARMAALRMALAEKNDKTDMALTTVQCKIENAATSFS